jgi:hypothetical protein
MPLQTSSSKCSQTPVTTKIKNKVPIIAESDGAHPQSASTMNDELQNKKLGNANNAADGAGMQTPQPYLHATWPPRLTTSKGPYNLDPLIALKAEYL